MLTEYCVNVEIEEKEQRLYSLVYSAFQNHHTAEYKINYWLNVHNLKCSCPHFQWKTVIGDNSPNIQKKSHSTTEKLVSLNKKPKHSTHIVRWNRLKYGSPLTWERQAVTPKKIWHDSGEKPFTLESRCQGCKII